ncbi:hypothetical protein DFH06DRAFT_1331102 [Mycena polygramma]|nr:hypothetical protein DFH06DRAFT_1331102 [Mycena polygramma]
MLPPPPGVRQVDLTPSPVTSDAPETQIVTETELHLGMEVILPVYSSPWTDPLPVTTVIPSKDVAISALDHHLITRRPRRSGLKGITSTAPRSGQFRAIHYDQLIRRAMDRLPALRITNIWTPAHIGGMTSLVRLAASASRVFVG